MSAREELLGELAERVIDVFRFVQREVLIPHPGLVHITRSEADVMRIITATPGATVSEIARAFGQHKSNTSTSIASLVEKGLAQKRSEGADAREVRVYPTEMSSRNLSGHREVWARLLDPATQASDEQLRETVDVLAEIAAALQQLQQPQQPSA